MKEKKRGKLIAFLIIVLGIGGSFFKVWYFWSGKLAILKQQVGQLENRVHSKKVRLAQLKSFAKNIEIIKQELKELNAQIEAAMQNIPQDYALSTLLKRFAEIAKNSGLEIYTFEPQLEGEVREEKQLYASATVKLNVQGSYTQLLQFLDQISRLPRILNVVTLHIEAKPELVRSVATQASSSVVIRIYRFIGASS